MMNKVDDENIFLVGEGYGPDYGTKDDGRHYIYEVEGLTGPGIFYLHRYTRKEQEFSAIYKGHHPKEEALRSDEQEMICNFINNRESYL